MKKVKTGGGWPALLYTLRKGREAGGVWKLWKAMPTDIASRGIDVDDVSHVINYELPKDPERSVP